MTKKCMLNDVNQVALFVISSQTCVNYFTQIEILVKMQPLLDTKCLKAELKLGVSILLVA